MSDPLDAVKKYVDDLKLKSRVEALAAKVSPRFGSSRLLVTLGVITGLIWLFHGQIQGVVHEIVILVLAFGAYRTVTDSTTIVMDGLIKREVAKQLSRDGALSDEDQTAIDEAADHDA